MKKITLIALLTIIVQCGFSQQPANKVAPLNEAQTKEIVKLQTQVETLQKELTTSKDEYTKSLIHNEDHFKCYQSSVAWGVGIIGVLFAIIVGLLGGLLPYLINKSNRKDIDKKMKDITTSLNTVKEDVQLVQQLKGQVEVLKLKIDKSEEEAKKSEIKAEASKLFAEAYNEKDPNEQIELYTKVIKLTPDDSDAYNNLGSVYYRLSRFNEAIESYCRAITISPDDVDIYCNRGDAYDELAKFNEAIKDFTTAIEINPKYAAAYNGRANSYMKTKKYKEALIDVNIALRYTEDKDEKSACLDTRGDVYYEIGEYEKALADYTEAITLNPQYWESYYKRGLTYQALSVLPETSPEKQEEYANLAEQDFKTAKDNGYKPKE